MRADLLHVVTAIANPIKWQSRIKLYKDFEEHMLDSGVKLTVVECAYGERPFECNVNPHVHHVGVRAKTIVWNKENLINLGINSLSDAKYIAWIDADVEFRRDHWAVETVHALQQYDVIQPWSDAYDLGPHDEHLGHFRSFCSLFATGQQVIPTSEKFWKWSGGPYEYAHPGYAWAATRQALEWSGGLLETAAMGAGDHHMALALVGGVLTTVPANSPPGYTRHLLQWQKRVLHHINYNIGFVHGTIEHSFHGAKGNRRYQDRWDMFIRHGFDPDTDLKRNLHGVLELAGNKPELRRELDVYFRGRDEDANTLTAAPNLK